MKTKRERIEEPAPLAHAKLTVKTLPLAKLKPHPKNPRKHPPEGSDEWNSLKASLADHYFDPLVWNSRNGMLVSGHLRRKILESMRCKRADVVVLDLDEKQHVQIMLRANVNSGEWATDILSELLKGMDEAEQLLGGFDIDSVEALIGVAAEPDIDAEPQIDRASELQKKWKTKTGQLWTCGSHRILCGDATNANDVERLLDGVVPVLMVTDPPYGVEYDPSWRARAGVNINTGKMGKVMNDDIADWSAAWKLFAGDVAYVYHAGVMASTVQESIETCGFKIRAQIIWAKDRMALSRGDYHWQHEPCWYAVRDGNPGHRTDDRSQTTLWEIPARDDSGHGHGTQKPVECMARPIRNHHAPQVYDPFCGSGTTIIAAERLARKCFAMEINPCYVAVILQRYKDATGKTPKMESQP